MSYNAHLACREICEYLDIIDEAALPVCRDQVQLAAYVRRIFAAEDLFIDLDQLGKYLNLQKYFPFRLFPWEKFCFAIHNCVYTKAGRLRWPELLIYVGRGAGKNGYLSFEDFALITRINNVPKYHIDIFATSEDQAQTSFKDVYDVLDANKKKLQRWFSWNKEVIENRQTGSQLRFRTSNAKTKDGGRPGKVDFDEYHAYENYKMLSVARTGLGKKQFPRSTIITTDGDVRDGPLDHTLARARQILQGAIPDNGLFPFLCSLDADEDVANDLNWHKANPSLRYFPELMEEMKREYADYTEDKIGNSAFMTKRMNRPQGAKETEVTAWENILACSVDAPTEPTVWVAGIDFAKTTDFVSVVLFGLVGDTWVWHQHSWVCRSCGDLSRIRFPLDDAAARGLMEWVPGVDIPAEIPAAYLAQQMETKQILAVAIDEYRFAMMRNALAQVGFIPGKDGNIHFAKGKDIMSLAPTLISKFAHHEIAFGDDPMMRWYINNAKQCMDARGNITFGKIEPKTRKTDGFMAAVASGTLVELLESAQGNWADDVQMQVYSY